MTAKEQPTWQPISTLPFVAKHLAAGLEAAQENLQNFQRVADRPGSLDDHTVERAISVYSRQAEDLWLFHEQLARWKKLDLTAAQRNSLGEAEKNLNCLDATVKELMPLLYQLRSSTIDKILGMSDMEVALNVLSGKLKSRI